MKTDYMNQIIRISPEPWQESVWDYPRPPKIEKTSKHLKVVVQNTLIAETRKGLRILETSHPPVYLFPPENVKMEFLKPNLEIAFCEFKGKTNYYDVKVDSQILYDVAWVYFKPTSLFEAIRGYIGFFAHKTDGCFVDGEQITPQEGGFYSGWITKDIVGPFKGGSGTWDW
jgi:uncharacterized protein (DUF427 family)